MVKLGHVALDGTKVRANASKHKAMSYQRMREHEAQLQGEWSLICTGHNLLKLFKFGNSTAHPQWPSAEAA